MVSFAIGLVKPSKSKTWLVRCTLLGAAGLSLFSMSLLSIATWSNRRVSVHRYVVEYPSLVNTSLLPWKAISEDECDSSSASAPTGRISDFNGVDLHVYKAFASKNVSSLKGLELLSTSARADIANDVGLSFNVAARVFKLCHSYIKSFNRCHYRLLSNPGPCSSDAAATSVIMVHSLPASTKRRMDIRARMNQFLPTGYRLVFLLGQSESMQSAQDVRKEAAVFGDILWANFYEDYDNLTIKTLVMLRWVQENCQSARYLVKADDDVYLKMSNLATVLNAHANQSHIIMGTIARDKGAFRDVRQKWYMPTYMFSGIRYPPFAYGPSYIISTDLLADLTRAALKVNYMHLEDIFIAICASNLANVNHVNVPSFISDSCSFSHSVACHGLICP